MATHYADLGEGWTACGKECCAPSEDEHTTSPLRRDGADSIIASLDFRAVTCSSCIDVMPFVVPCHCGAPALYGQDRPGVSGRQWCKDHTPEACRCQQCNRPLLDAAASFCDRCLDADSPDTGDGITEYGDPAGCGGARAW